MTTEVIRSAAPLREQVVALLRSDLLDGVFQPGDRLREPELCARFGVSRTVIREALRHLESESLVTLVPHRGPIVAVLTESEILGLYEVRAELEGLVGELFARRSSDGTARRLVRELQVMEIEYLHGDEASRGRTKDDFYRILLEGADNEVLRSTLEGIHARVGVFRHYAFTSEERVRTTMSELRSIVDAAAVRRDPVAARRACHHHIELAGRLAIFEYQRRHQN